MTRSYKSFKLVYTNDQLA